MREYSVLPMQVFPKKFKLGLEPGEFGCSFFAILLIFAICYAIYIHRTLAKINIYGVVIVFTMILSAVWGVIVFVRYQIARSKQRAETAKAEQKALQDVEDRTRHARAALEAIAKAPRKLTKILKKVERNLSRAENEYSASAYGPFWDQIEAVTEGLKKYNSWLERVEKNADTYRDVLSGWNHTFPSVIINRGDFPDPTSAIHHLGRLVRQGQTNRDFAIIWEHRRTQKAIIEGFRDLQQAIYGIGETVQDSFSYVESSIVRELSVGSVELRSQGRTLKEIQRDLARVSRK